MPLSSDSETNSTGVQHVERVPALKTHTIKMYEAMVEESNPNADELIYEGYISKTYARTGASHSWQTHVVRILKDFNCIAIVRVGVRNTPTRAIMLNHPGAAGIPASAWRVEKNAPEGLTNADDAGRLAESVRNLQAQVGPVSLPNLASAIDTELRGIKDRLDKLEQKA